MLAMPEVDDPTASVVIGLGPSRSTFGECPMALSDIIDNSFSFALPERSYQVPKLRLNNRSITPTNSLGYDPLGDTTGPGSSCRTRSQ